MHGASFDDGKSRSSSARLSTSATSHEAASNVAQCQEIAQEYAGSSEVLGAPVQLVQPKLSTLFFFYGPSELYLGFLCNSDFWEMLLVASIQYYSL